ncbi:hypothetical protein LTR15_009800 [Elasticomyces elasticus]|nr:hypothetical protein LTR15_009800 [Elasticomyces elasticus]
MATVPTNQSTVFNPQRPMFAAGWNSAQPGSAPMNAAPTISSYPMTAPTTSSMFGNPLVAISTPFGGFGNPFGPPTRATRVRSYVGFEQTVALTITARPEHQAQSLEELRFADYQAGRGKPPTNAFSFGFSPASQSCAFKVPGKGLLHLQLSTTQRGARIQYRHHPAIVTTCPDLGTNTIVFSVGGSEGLPFQRFVVHENAVRPVAEFVKLALTGEWKEATERTIPLPEDEPAVFHVYQTGSTPAASAPKHLTKFSTNASSNATSSARKSSIPHSRTLLWTLSSTEPPAHNSSNAISPV